MTLLTLFLASDLFPWDGFSYYTSLGNIMAQIQFPWRYLTYATLFSVLALGELLELAQKHAESASVQAVPVRPMALLCALICALSMVDLLWFHGSYASSNGRIHVDNTAEVDIGSRDFTHYMRNDSTIDKLTYEIKTENAEYLEAERDGTDMSLYIETHEPGGNVSVPIFNYKGYHVIDEYGTEYEIYDGENKEICFSVEPNFKGNVSVSFVPPWYWIAAGVISEVFLMYIAVWSIHKKKRA